MKRLLEEVAHRPWPLPRRPRVMAQRWHEVLFAHWQVPVEALRRLVPAPLELDTVGEQAWIGVIPFRMSGVRLRWAPALPGLSAFPELNVRTYVVFGGKPGVFFFSLDAANRLAVEVARRWYRLPYFHARMTIERRGEWFEYESRRVGAEADFIGRYRPLDRRVAESAEDSQRRIHHRDTLRLRSGQAEITEKARARAGQPSAGPTDPSTALRASRNACRAKPATLEHWLVERYCLYTVDGHGRAWRGEIHHRPWSLRPAEAEIARNTMTAPLGLELHGAPLLHFAEELEVVVWPLRQIQG